MRRPLTALLLALSAACTCGGGTLLESESSIATCRDHVDNDGDGLIDCRDPGCAGFVASCAGGTGGGSSGGDDAGGCGTPEDRVGCSCATPNEARPCYRGPRDTRNEGACRDGMQTCVAGTSELGATWSACSGDTQPATEVCTDALDHDCNGASGCTDVGCATVPACIIECGPGQTRPCYSGPAASAGVGACHAGTQTCDAMSHWLTTCPGEQTPQSNEIGRCTNALDDDCDGKADCQDLDCLLATACAPMTCSPSTMQACYDGPAGTNGVAACHGGTQTCASDGRSYGPCTGQVLPASERTACADGVDNDCNGKIDCADAPCETAATCCVRPDGGVVDGTIYAHSSSDLYIVNPSGWTVTRVGAFGNGDEMTDIAVTPAGLLYGVSFTTLYRIDKTNAHATAVGPVSGSSNNGLTFIARGDLLAADSAGELKRISPTAGTVTGIGNYGSSLSSSGDLVAVASGTMYGVSDTTAGGGSASGNNRLLRVDVSTGTATVVGPIGFGNVWGLAYVNGKVIGFTTAGQIIEIDPATGAGTLLATRSVVFWGAGMSPLVEGNPCP